MTPFFVRKEHNHVIAFYISSCAKPETFEKWKINVIGEKIHEL